MRLIAQPPNRTLIRSWFALARDTPRQSLFSSELLVPGSLNYRDRSMMEARRRPRAATSHGTAADGARESARTKRSRRESRETCSHSDVDDTGVELRPFDQYGLEISASHLPGSTRVQPWLQVLWQFRRRLFKTAPVNTARDVATLQRTKDRRNSPCGCLRLTFLQRSENVAWWMSSNAHRRVVSRAAQRSGENC